MKHHLNQKEREKLNKLIVGKGDLGCERNKKFLAQPHIAVAFESILDQTGLTDSVLADRMAAIINRQPLKSRNKTTGHKSSNQSALDTNTLNAIKMIWQMKGKFTEKHEFNHSGGITNLPDEQLDKIIEQGGTFLQFKKTRIEKNDNTDQSADIESETALGSGHRGETQPDTR